MITMSGYTDDSKQEAFVKAALSSKVLGVSAMQSALLSHRMQ